MTLMLHPNKDTPERYRVQSKQFGIQEYFPLTKAGKEAAERLQRTIEIRQKAHELRRLFAINRLFRDDGTLCGVSIITRRRPGRPTRICLECYANYKQNTFPIIDGWDQAFKKAIHWIYAQYEISETMEIKQRLRRAEKRLQRQYWALESTPWQ